VNGFRLILVCIAGLCEVSGVAHAPHLGVVTISARKPAQSKENALADALTKGRIFLGLPMDHASADRLFQMPQLIPEYRSLKDALA